jgi:hypothetical protein
MKRFEAEEELIRRQKLEEANKAEFEAEQTYLDTLAHLPGKDADKYRDMQGLDKTRCLCSIRRPLEAMLSVFVAQLNVL